MAQLTMIQAITEALAIEIEKDENVLVFGEDVGNNGGVFRATEGLQEKFGEERVFDTPLAESGIGGLAFGLALENYRPIMEVQFFGFVFEEPGAVVVYIHGPGLVIFPQHHVFHGVDPRYAKRGVRVVVIAIDADLPVVDALRCKGI